MRIFFAVPSGKTFFDMMKEVNAENILISYAFFKKSGLWESSAGEWFPKNLIIDSGAFSVWSNGQTIDIDKYAKFCVAMKEIVPPTTDLKIVNLDVIPGKFGTFPTEQERKDSVRRGWENMLYLESKGLKVIPVFHQHEDFEWLHKMVEHVDYLGLSPANDEHMNSKVEWLKQGFSITRDKTKVHGFAVTGYDQLINFPFYSVDSSSWAAGGRFARIPIIKDGKIKSFHFKDKKQLLESWSSIDPEYKDIFTNYRNRDMIGIRAFQKFQTYITKVWTERGIKWE